MPALRSINLPDTGRPRVAAQAVPPLPASANTADFTLDVRPSERDVQEEYFQTVPQGLSSADEAPKGPRLGSLLEGPKGKEVQQCTRKCVPTCIRGGQGAPGLGPMSVRKEIVVFKEGYRTRTYCLSEWCDLHASAACVCVLLRDALLHGAWRALTHPPACPPRCCSLQVCALTINPAPPVKGP